MQLVHFKHILPPNLIPSKPHTLRPDTFCPPTRTDKQLHLTKINENIPPGETSIVPWITTISLSCESPDEIEHYLKYLVQDIPELWNNFRVIIKA